MPLCVADNARMAFVNRANSVNLSTNFKNPAANTNARVLCPVPIQITQGPRQPPRLLGRCTVNLAVNHPPALTNFWSWAVTQRRGFPTPYPPNIPRVPGDVGAPVDASPLFVVGRRHLPSVLAFGDPAFEFCISRYQASIAFAGGAITDGVWGLEKTCYRCCGCYERC